MWGAFSSIFRESGVAGLFRGFTATAIRDAPYAGLYVLFYEESKMVAGAWWLITGRYANGRADYKLSLAIAPPDKLLSTRLDAGIPPTVIHSVSGIAAATLATLSTAPADCIKVGAALTFCLTLVFDPASGRLD